MVGGMTAEGIRRFGDNGTFTVSILVYGVRRQGNRHTKRENCRRHHF